MFKALPTSFPLPQPPKCWDYRCIPPHPASSCISLVSLLSPSAPVIWTNSLSVSLLSPFPSLFHNFSFFLNILFCIRMYEHVHVCICVWTHACTCVCVYEGQTLTWYLLFLILKNIYLLLFKCMCVHA